MYPDNAEHTLDIIIITSSNTLTIIKTYFSKYRAFKYQSNLSNIHIVDYCQAYD